MFIQRAVIGNREMQHWWGVAKAMDKCTVFPKEDMRWEQDGEGSIVISKTGTTYKQKKKNKQLIFLLWMVWDFCSALPS